MRRLAIAGFVLAAAAFGCQDPTQITLVLSTNAVCEDVEGTAITAGAPGQLEARAPAATTTACTLDAGAGRIGTLVLIPSGDNDAPVGVKVALALGGDLDACLNPPYAESCIIARRSLRYIPHTPLTLPIELDVDCAGKFCDELTTCIDGRCVNATIDPHDCLEPSGCVPGSDGGGGAGGAGPADCGAPVTTSPLALTGVQLPRDHLAIAADAGGCSWALAWSEAATEACTRLVGPEGMPLGMNECVARSAIDDADVASLGGGVFALADWSGTPGEARLSTVDAGGIVSQVTLGNAAGGALAARDDTLLMVYELETGALRYATFSWNGATLSPPTQQQPIGSEMGTVSDVAWGAADAVVSWNSSATTGNVMRFVIGSSVTGAPVERNAITNVALANHAPSEVTAIIFNDENGNGELATWPAGGSYTDGGYSAVDYSGTAAGFAITGTTSGWVVGFIDEGKGWLTSFDATGQYIVTVREVASDATAIALAAIGDQLGVVWLDAQGEIWFRRVAFDLDTL